MNMNGGNRLIYRQHDIGDTKGKKGQHYKSLLVLKLKYSKKIHKTMVDAGVLLTCQIIQQAFLLVCI